MSEVGSYYLAMWGQFHITLIFQFYYVSPSNELRIFVYYSYIQYELGHLGGVILPTICATIIVRPNIVLETYYS